MEEQKKTSVEDSQTEASEWQWCGYCGRASKSNIAYNCGYEDCDAGIETVFTWKYVRGINPDLPEIPVRDVVYSMTRSK